MRENVVRCEKASWRRGQRGQTIIFVVLGLSLVFLAVLGFAVDFGNLWFHRQAAQTAADAACTAAAMNMLDNAQGGNSGGFAWSDFDCAAMPNSAPCKYLNLNGYNVTGLQPNTTSSGASFSFTNSVTGVPTCTTPPDPKYTMCIPPGSALGPTAQPVVRVSLTDRIKAPFFSLIAAKSTIDVPAKSSCGVVLATSTLPILVLYPRTDRPSLTGSGIAISFYGGPNRSIQVNERGNDALNLNGGTINLSQGGPNNTGSDFGVAGNTPQPPINLLLGTTGHYTSPASPTSDPFALMNAPEVPTFPNAIRRADGSDPDSPTVPPGTSGCAGAANCIHFKPGYYPNGIQVNSVAIFDPGIYYITNGFNSHACMRPSTDQGDGSGGTAFYFADNSSIDIDSASGPNSACVTPFQPLMGSGYLANGIKCTPTSTAPNNLQNINGTVLLAPCTGPDPSTNLCAPNCTLNAGNGLGDQVNSSDPAKVQRGILFFQNRSISTPAMPTWDSTDQFLLSGTLYFHQCTTTGSLDVGTGCDATGAFNDQFTLRGGSGLDTFFLGNIVTDQLNLNGAQMTIDLNPSAGYWVLKASLLQ